MSNGFLSRWSQRKLRAASAPSEEQAAEARPPEPQAPEATAGEEPAPASPATGDNEITPEELAALPAPEQLTASSDVTGFLRKGVPAALRNQALRRLWTIDPAIRDFVGDARDYAWDWNTPGGVPCTGPLASTVDVGKMVRGIFGQDPEAAADVPESVERANVMDGPAKTATHEPLAPKPPEIAERPGEQDMSPDEEGAEPSAPSGLRRHGGALPS